MNTKEIHPAKSDVLSKLSANSGLHVSIHPFLTHVHRRASSILSA
jgi:hypothetical protein